MNDATKLKIREILKTKATDSNLSFSDLMDFGEDSLQEICSMLHESVRRQLSTIDILEEILKTIREERRNSKYESTHNEEP